ncbi:unnamed protein product [Ectocarpus fasciculatus]
MMAVWDVFPVSRRLQTMQGHSDSVQASTVLTWTGGGKRLASGALDGSVVVWSVSAEGDALDPVFRYSGFCHPYRLVAIGRCLAFTSSDAPTVDALLDGPSSRDASSRDATTPGNQGHHGHRDGGSDDSPLLPVSRGAHISVVDVDSSPSLGVDMNPRCARVATGHRRLQHLVAGASIGSVALSQTESWAADSDSSGIDSDDEDNIYLGGGGAVNFRPPRLCRVLRAARVTSFGQRHAAGVESRPFSDGAGSDGRGGGGGGDGGALEAEWVSVSGHRPSPTRDTAPRHDSMHGGGLGGRPFANSNSRTGNDDDDDGGAFCTGATFVGRTLFLGYDTGDIWAHRAFDGRRLYRLSALGPLARLTEADGSLFAYSSSGVVSRWSWGDGAR